MPWPEHGPELGQKMSTPHAEAQRDLGGIWARARRRQQPLDQRVNIVANINAAHGKIACGARKYACARGGLAVAVAGGAQLTIHRCAVDGAPGRAGSFRILSRRVDLEGQGMDLALELGRQRLVDEAMARQARFAGKQRGYDQHAKVAFAGAGELRWPACRCDSLITSRRTGWNACVSFSRIVDVDGHVRTFFISAVPGSAAIMAHVQRSAAFAQRLRILCAPRLAHILRGNEVRLEILRLRPRQARSRQGRA